MGKTFKDSKGKGRFIGNRNFRMMKQYRQTATYPTIRCGSTGKVGFKDMNDAQAKVDSIQENEPNTFLRVYRCEFCKHYHLSSKPLKQTQHHEN